MPIAFMQSMTPCAPVLSDCAVVGAIFGLGAEASAFSVVWKPVSFATCALRHARSLSAM